VMQPHRDGCSV